MTCRDKGSTRGGHCAAPHRSGAGKWAAGFAVFLLILMAFSGISVVAHAGTTTMVIRATVLSKSNCRFNTGTSTLNFGALDPATSLDVAATTSIPYICHGSAPVATFAISDDGGRNPAGPGSRRMRHNAVPAEFLPYSMTLSPAFGTAPKNVGQTLAVTGTVLGADYRGSRAGSYSDTVVVSILP